MSTSLFMTVRARDSCLRLVVSLANRSMSQLERWRNGPMPTAESPRNQSCHMARQVVDGNSHASGAWRLVPSDQWKIGRGGDKCAFGGCQEDLRGAFGMEMAWVEGDDARGRRVVDGIGHIKLWDGCWLDGRGGDGGGDCFTRQCCSWSSSSMEALSVN
ncbi:hypothetical protein H257_02873 [Aphanomyces astaci]|uniref:Uncharacterized protein n=1 Tax=Aphanomyces astaci TaxID=112090 RepID=W4GZ13_APHAT|nr:hypothetical protein H257_02873 [Aphanomyces astaci]ETV84980.1 hypothetical protein H257_02873 [Aphanomyces astaci]|eukprot:XP_009824998.1 hypothetical protein H257_02873 [Aphanomyces astaci]